MIMEKLQTERNIPADRIVSCRYDSSTYLTGRYISFRIFTLSFSKYLMFREKYDTVGDPRTELADYVRLGGFPAVHLQKYSQEWR